MVAHEHEAGHGAAEQTERVLTKDSYHVPEGWHWKGEWKIDHKRAVDGNGEDDGSVVAFID